MARSQAELGNEYAESATHRSCLLPADGFGSGNQCDRSASVREDDEADDRAVVASHDAGSVMVGGERDRRVDLPVTVADFETRCRDR